MRSPARVLLIAVLLSGCRELRVAPDPRKDDDLATDRPSPPLVGEETVPPAPESSSAPAPRPVAESIGPPAPTAAPETSPGASGFAGTVVETMSAGPYSYLQVDTGDRRNWVAAPKLEVRVGDSVLVPSGMVMSNFHSRSLNRTFETIYFAGAVEVSGKPVAPSAGAGRLPSGHPALPGTGKKEAALPEGHVPIPDTASGSQSPPGHPPVTRGGAPPPKVDLEGIEKAEGGMTVAEVFAARRELAGKQVLVRGKVVKYNAGILNRNWIHVQDGSGAAGTNDLTVTTKSVTQVGDTVLLRGRLSLDRDFGAGYRYEVVVEDATVTVE